LGDIVETDAAYLVQPVSWPSGRFVFRVQVEIARHDRLT
jgi:hypothetical protein